MRKVTKKGLREDWGLSGDDLDYIYDLTRGMPDLDHIVDIAYRTGHAGASSAAVGRQRQVLALFTGSMSMPLDDVLRGEGYDEPTLLYDAITGRWYNTAIEEWIRKFADDYGITEVVDIDEVRDL